MGGIFSSPKPPPPPPPPPPIAPPPAPPERTLDTGPTAEQKNEARKKAEAERMRQAKTKGRASTILTSGQGAPDDAATVTKTLLGE